MMERIRLTISIIAAILMLDIISGGKILNFIYPLTAKSAADKVMMQIDLESAKGVDI